MGSPTEGYVYLGQADHLYKIGASKQPAMRAIQLQNDTTIRPKNISGDVAIKWKLWVKNYKLIERILHTRFASRQVIGEWFALTQSDLDWLIAQTEETLLRDAPQDLVARIRKRQAESKPRARRQAPEHDAQWGRVDCTLGAIYAFNHNITTKLSMDDVRILSGISPATFWRIAKNTNDRISTDVLARCCAALGITISDLLFYWFPGNPSATFNAPILRHIADQPLPCYGRVAVVLRDVLQGYTDISGNQISDLHKRIQTPRKTIDALLEEQTAIIDLSVLARLVTALTAIAQKSFPVAVMFNAWLRECGYTPGTVGLVLKYVPPDGRSEQRSTA